MNSMIAQQPDVFSALHNPALSAYVRNAAELMPDESALLATAIKSLMISHAYVTNKDIILWLIGALETTHDATTADVIRHCLELVVSYTMDDI
ncbi:MAG: hypothetical protein K0R86_1949 [Enterobacter kobei]|jgi:hypothetical protein|nr:hypothetical protein [Enterobacter kobei]SIQ77733.1 Biofilm development protein YmgB/AriR [Enterobacter kobei]